LFTHCFLLNIIIISLKILHIGSRGAKLRKFAVPNLFGGCIFYKKGKTPNLEFDEEAID